MLEFVCTHLKVKVALFWLFLRFDSGQKTPVILPNSGSGEPEPELKKGRRTPVNNRSRRFRSNSERNTPGELLQEA